MAKKKCICCDNEIDGPYLEIITQYHGHRYICMDNCGTFRVDDNIDTSCDGEITVIVYHSGDDDE